MNKLLHLLAGWLLVCLVGTFNLACPQVTPGDRLIDQLTMLENGGQEDAEDGFEALLMQLHRPLNLNKADREALMALPWITSQQAQALIDHRGKYGQLLSIFELQAVAGWDSHTIEQLLPFIRVAELVSPPATLLQKMLRADYRYWLVRYDRVLETKRGYFPGDSTQQRYLGSPDRLLIRVRSSQARDFTWGFTAEKDPGEQITWDPNTHRYGMDFYSGHIGLYHKGRVKALMLGDYQLQIGQGLMLSAGFQIGKSAETIYGARRHNRGILPYASAVETGFFRGAATTISLTNHLDFTIFLSSRSADATLEADTTELVQASAIQQTGLHRTPREISRKGVMQVRDAGAGIRYANRTFQAGTTLLYTQFSYPWVRASRKYNQFDFRGRELLNVGMDFSYDLSHVSFFGETVYASSGGVGSVAGFLLSLPFGMEYAWLYRNYARNFHAFYGNAFGESNRNNNETGLYQGLKWRLYKKWELSAYFDVFRFPWLRYLVDAPSEGHEQLLRVAYRPNRKTVAFVQMRWEQKGQNLAGQVNPLHEVVPTHRQSFWLSYETSPHRNWTFRSRLQGSTFSQGNPQQGVAFIQDITWQVTQKLRLCGRYASFDTDWDTRQYALEKDVLYAFTVPPYYGQGTRKYLLVKYALLENIDCWLKYGVTTRADVAHIGSGLERTEGPIRSEIRWQVRCTF